MKKGFRIITAVLLAVLFSITSLQAAESAAETGLSFEGDSEKFITYEQQSAYENMMPGEKRVQRITLTNNDEEELKFYVRAEYTDPLGEAVADGHVAYNVEFVTNNESFYTGRIGGVTKANMNSLETNYLLRSIKKGETATIDFILQVDGDSMNDTYQDTEGRLRFIFSVEHMNSAPVEQAANIVKKIPVINKIPGVNTGITYEQQSAYENMMPGEKRVQRITLTNNDEEELKFYVRAEYTDPLGEAVADGHVAYNVEFVTNNESFYTGRIGGVTKANMNSLETNYLLRSIKKGETATIDFILQVDGDSMNDTYQDTEGRLRFIFSVEHMNSAPVEQAANIVKKIPVINKIPGVNTGDPTTIGLILGFFAASAIGLILLIIIKVRSRRSEQND